MQANYVQRLRMEFAKLGPTRFIGHLDLAKALERSLNRAQIPLAYTQGYNPRPRMQLAAALPLGFTSECELADFWLLEAVDLQATGEILAAKLAPGIEIKGLSEIELREPALQNQVVAAEYLVHLKASPGLPQVRNEISNFLSAESIMRERRGKTYDLRPLVHDIGIVEYAERQRPNPGDAADKLSLFMRLSLLPGKTGRPDEVLEALRLDPLASLIHRQRIILADGQ